MANKNYTFGGYTGSANTNAIYKFDNATETFSTVSATLATARREVTTPECNVNSVSKIPVINGYTSAAYEGNQVFATDTETLSSGTNTPAGVGIRGGSVHGAAGGKYGSYLGGSASNNICRKEHYQYDASSDTWATLSSYVQYVRWHASFAVWSSCSHVLSGNVSTNGTDGGVIDKDMIRVNVILGTCVTETSHPTDARFRSGWTLGDGIDENSKTFVCGGHTGSVSYTIKETQRYDLGFDTWTAQTNMPAGGRYVTQFGQSDVRSDTTNGYIFGGAYNDGGGTTYFATTLKYNQAGNSWSTVTGGDLPVALGIGGSASNFIITPDVVLYSEWVACYFRAGGLRAYNTDYPSGTTLDAFGSIYQQVGSKTCIYCSTNGKYYLFYRTSGTMKLYKTTDGVSFTQVGSIGFTCGSGKGFSADLIGTTLYVAYAHDTQGVKFCKVNLTTEAFDGSEVSVASDIASDVCISLAKDSYNGEKILITYQVILSRWRYSADTGATWSSEQVYPTGHLYKRLVHHYNHISSKIEAIGTNDATGSEDIDHNTWDPATLAWTYNGPLSHSGTNPGQCPFAPAQALDCCIDQRSGHIYTAWAGWQGGGYNRFNYTAVRLKYSAGSWLEEGSLGVGTTEIYSGEGTPRVGCAFTPNNYFIFALVGMWILYGAPPTRRAQVMVQRFDPGANGTTNDFTDDDYWNQMYDTTKFYPSESAISVGTGETPVTFNTVWENSPPADPEVISPTTIEAVSYGGRIYKPSTEVFDKGKKVRATVYGHMKVMETVPFWKITKELGPLFTVTGVTLVEYTPRTEGQTVQGVKSLKYKFPEDNPLKQLTVRTVEANYVGLHWIHFSREELKFAYHDGAWTTLSLDTLGQDLDGGAAGDDLVVDLSKYPDESGSVLLDVQRLESAEHFLAPYQAGEIGRATLCYDNGQVTECRDFFSAAVFYDGTNYNDITADLLMEDADAVIVLEDSSDALFIGDSTIFTRINFAIKDALAGATLTVQYSKSFKVWKALTLTKDTTNNLTQNGYFRFVLPDDWHPTALETAGGAAVRSNKFWIKISINITSTLTLYYLKKNILLRGQLGDLLEVQVSEEGLPTQDQEDQVVIRERNAMDTTPIVATYYQCITTKAVAEKIADELGYPSSQRDLSRISNISLPAKAAIVLGNMPLLNYPKKPSCVKYVDAISTLFVGVGGELWKMEDSVGEWIKVGELAILSGWCDIIRIEYGTDGRIYAFGALDPYPKTYPKFTDYNRANKAVAVATDVARTSFDYNRRISETVVGIQADMFNLGIECCRKGRYWSTDRNAVGSDAFIGQDCGEQIAILYPQPVAAKIISGFVLYDSESLISSTASGSGRFYFWSSNPGVGIAYGSQFAGCPPGWYALLDNKAGDGDMTDCLFSHSFGQSYLLAWDPTSKIWLCNLYKRGTDTTFQLNGLDGALSSAGDINTTGYQCNDPGEDYWNWLALAYWEATRKFVGAHTQWYEQAGSTSLKSFSYISRLYHCKDTVDNWPGPYPFDRVWHYNATGPAYTDITSDMNAGSGSAILNEGNDAIYVGNINNMFFQILFKISGTPTPTWTLKYEYYNGSAWADLDTCTDGDLQDETSGLVDSGFVSWRVPRNWTQTTVNSVEAYYVRVRVHAYTSNNSTIAGVLQAAEVVWNSQYETGREAYEPIYLTVDTDLDVVHVVFADKAALLWRYCVLELNSSWIPTYSDIVVDQQSRDTRCLKQIAYWSTQGKVYGVLCDLKHSYYPITLVEITYDGVTRDITMTSKGILDPLSFDIKNIPLCFSETRGIFGVSRNGSIWNWTTIIIPQIGYAQLPKEANCREALNYIAQISNCWWYIKGQKYLVMESRATTPVYTKKLSHQHIVSIEPVTRWQHLYDGVEVSWADMLPDREEGTAQFGIFGYGKNTLSIDNPFIQDRYLAAHIAKTYGRFFTKLRRARELKGTYLVQLEEGDGITLTLPTRYSDIREARAWIITATSLDLKEKQMTLKLLEDLEA